MANIQKKETYVFEDTENKFYIDKEYTQQLNTNTDRELLYKINMKGNYLFLNEKEMKGLIDLSHESFTHE